MKNKFEYFTKKKYTAHISHNRHSFSFDGTTGRTPESAARALKRKNSPDWRDCCIWVTGPYGYKKTMYDGSN